MEGLNFDLRQQSVRELNQFLHSDAGKASPGTIEVHHPDGAHSIAAGLNAPVKVVVHGHAGYYAAGMNMHADITIDGSAGTGVAENMMSGRVRVKGFASNSAGASAHGGLLVIEGNAALRCGISLKGGNIVVGGSVGSFSAFMAQAGRMVVCGDAGDGLGDSLYEAVLYVKGSIKSLGADAQLEPMGAQDLQIVTDLLAQAGMAQHSAADFKRVASKRELYHWNADANQEY